MKRGERRPAVAPGAWMGAIRDLRADAFRRNGRFSWGDVLKGVLLRRTFRVVFTLRLCQGLAAAGLPGRLLLPFARLLHRFACGAAGIDLPWATSIGGGLAITHGWGLVVSPGARIGRNVTLFHGATLGRGDRIARDGTRQTAHPVLEDDVWVGPHAIIVGGVTIGRGSRIAGGAVVTESVPPASFVAGNPARVVRGDCMPDVLNRAPD